MILPWYLVIVHKYGMLFIKEQLSMLNFIRYSNIKKIGYVLLMAIVGFLPWVPSFIAILASKLKDNLLSRLDQAKRYLKSLFKRVK